MPFVKMIYLYFLTFLVFIVVDLVWLGFIAKKLYRKYLGSFMSDKINWLAAIIFYLLFIVGILIFVVLPAHEKVSLARAALYGALFGLFTYATYDLTNLATLKDWPLPIVFIDIVWGMALACIVATSSFLFTRWLA